MLKKFLLILFLGNLALFSQEKNVELATLQEIVEIMEKNYYDETYGGINWKEKVEETKKKILESANSRQKYQHISDLLAQLGHSHLEFSPVIGNKKKKVKMQNGLPKKINFSLEQVEGKWAVTKVVPESDAAQAGVKMGMVVSKINNIEVKELTEENKVMAYYIMNKWLMSLPSGKITLEIEGEEKLISWELQSFDGKFENLGYMSEPVLFEKKLLDEGRIGYVSFSVFFPTNVKEMVKAIREYRNANCEGIIIDVRNNPGGVATLAAAIAKEFCRENYSLGTQKGRDVTMTFPVIKQEKTYLGKVVILINGNSASTSEIFAAGTREGKTAFVIGETSAGMALPSIIVNLKDGSILQYPVADFKTESGKNIEGVGAIPDEKVSHSLKSLSEGRDLFIEKAVEYIKQKTIESK